MLPDSFTALLIATVILATLLPARGEAAVAVGIFTKVMIALRFFM